MLYHNVRVLSHYLRLIDALIVALAMLLVWGAGGGFSSPETAASGNALATFLVVAAGSFLLLGFRLKIYHAWRTEGVLHELLILSETTLYATGLGCVAVESLTRGLPGRFYLAMFVAAAASVSGLRFAERVVVRYLRGKGDDCRIWLVVGDNERTRNLVESVSRNRHFGIRIDQVVDLEPKDEHDPDERRKVVGARVLSDVEGLREIVAERVIDEVVIMLPIRQYFGEAQRILDICCEAGISVKLPPRIFDNDGFKTEFSLVGDIPMVTHFNGPSNYWHLAVKRAMDLLGAIAGLTLLSPVFALIGAAIKLDSPGPAFFLQTRVGLHGRVFRMVKFRSMVEDAEQRQDSLRELNESDGVAFKIRNDPRISRVGRILRKRHLDELPQLWNVLRGDMSLVGPRPLPANEAQGEQWWQRRRLTVPPGLTCLWQVREESRIPFQDWMRLDIDYIDRWSVWLDLKLIFLTFRTIFQGRGW